MLKEGRFGGVGCSSGRRDCRGWSPEGSWGEDVAGGEEGGGEERGC